jgi:hypothetical protein
LFLTIASAGLEEGTARGLAVTKPTALTAAGHHEAFVEINLIDLVRWHCDSASALIEGL